MLRLAVGRGDPQQLRSVSRAFFQLEGVELPADDVVASASARGGDLLRSFIEEALARSALESHTRRVLSEALDTLADRMDHETFVAQALEWFSAVEGSPVAASERAFDDYEIERDIWSEITSQVTNRDGRVGLSLPRFLQELDLMPKAVPIPAGAVRCFTIHNAKGMEFPRVYLIGLAEDVLPSFQSIKKGAESPEMQEERRNCFVGITRTRERLTMTHALEYFGWPKQPSRFLREMGAVR